MLGSLIFRLRAEIAVLARATLATCVVLAMVCGAVVLDRHGLLSAEVRATLIAGFVLFAGLIWLAVYNVIGWIAHGIGKRLP